ncbi:MAG: hypothetical protein GYB37_07040 [Algicola sp.]|nr:hypothetical protein [Algicola sp.]
MGSAKYALNEGVSEDVLKNYLSRSITMAELCVPEGFYQDGAYPYKKDDFRMVQNIVPKFIGRTIFLWGNETKIENPAFLAGSESIVDQLHGIDPDIILQACIFEIVTEEVEKISVPAWAFEAFGVERAVRTFNYEAMLNTEGKYVDHWGGRMSVPDISRPETKMWFYFLAKKYIDIGMEAIHFGQVDLMAMTEDGYRDWDELLKAIRGYASKHARRKTVLCDAHVPFGGLVLNNHLLLDFHSFPLRAKEVPNEPESCVLEEGYLDSFYGRSKGGITPSGWRTEHLPYLVEFDNFGISDRPGVADLATSELWGYDEITWFSLQPKDYRDNWLEYANEWIRKTDQEGYLQMPGGRVIVPTADGKTERYRANTISDSCPSGYGQEEMIKKIWKNNDQ